MKNFIIAVLTILLITPAFAGDTKIIGVRAGYHQSDIYFNGNNSGHPNSGFYLGLFKNNKIIPTLNWMFGLEYFQNGYNQNSDNKWTLSTLSVPINLKFKVGPIFALGGLAANFKISETNVAGGIDLGNQANTFDLPLFLGAGFSILILDFEARYHWGMLDISDAGGKNQYLQIGVGASF